MQRAEERDTRLSIVPSILTSYCSYGNEVRLKLTMDDSSWLTFTFSKRIFSKRFHHRNIFPLPQPASLTDPYNTEDFVDSGSGNPLKLGIHGQAQFWNASLALHLAQAWMDRRASSVVQGRLGGGDANGNTLPFQSGDVERVWQSLGSESSTASGVDLAMSPCFSLDENVGAIPPAAPFPLHPPHLAGLRRTCWPGRSQLIKMHSGRLVLLIQLGVFESTEISTLGCLYKNGKSYNIKNIFSDTYSDFTSVWLFYMLNFDFLNRFYKTTSAKACQICSHVKSA